MIRERSELDAIASEIHASRQPIALDLETYGTSEDKKIRKGETVDPWRGEIRLLSLQSDSNTLRKVLEKLVDAAENRRAQKTNPMLPTMTIFFDDKSFSRIGVLFSTQRR